MHYETILNSPDSGTLSAEVAEFRLIRGKQRYRKWKKPTDDIESATDSVGQNIISFPSCILLFIDPFSPEVSST